MKIYVLLWAKNRSTEHPRQACEQCDHDYVVRTFSTLELARLWRDANVVAHDFTEILTTVVDAEE